VTSFFRFLLYIRKGMDYKNMSSFLAIIAKQILKKHIHLIICSKGKCVWLPFVNSYTVHGPIVF
jgi:hypothetical protein